MASLSNQGCFMIDGIEFQAKSLKVGFESLSSSDSGRTDDGVMHINWIYRRIRKIEIEMPPCTSAEASALLARVQGREYNITYFDPLSNRVETRGVYTSNTSGNLYSGVVRGGLWQGVSFNAIELEGE